MLRRSSFLIDFEKISYFMNNLFIKNYFLLQPFLRLKNIENISIYQSYMNNLYKVL
jgi:hypothetical protein